MRDSIFKNQATFGSGFERFIQALLVLVFESALEHYLNSIVTGERPDIEAKTRDAHVKGS